MVMRSPPQARQSITQMSPPAHVPSTPRRTMSPAQDKRTSQTGIFRSPPPLSNQRRLSNMLQSPSARVSSLSSEQYSEAIIGDLVEVPGNHLGVVMYVGPVEGRQGTFLGVDLNAPDLDKGRNDGTYNGIRYFNTKGPISGMFIPQGRCRVIEAQSRGDANQDNNRPNSQQRHSRTHSRVRSISTRSFSGLSLTESPRLVSAENFGRSEAQNQEAAAIQKILNENARLSRELDESQMRLIDLQKANAVQSHEMEELISTVSELESLQGPRAMQDGSHDELEELRSYIQDRERKIEEMRKEGEIRRTEFREATEHQQATIDELKALHQAQLIELQEKHDDIEERLLSSGGGQGVGGGNTEQLEALQAQLLELSDELDALVGQQERARQDIDIANSRILDLEFENNRLLEELAKVSVQLEPSNSAVMTPVRAARRMASTEQLNDNHPQKRQTIAFLEHELEELREANKHALASNDKNAAILPDLLQELETLRATVATLQSGGKTSSNGEATIAELKAALETEKRARSHAEDQQRQVEETLERTILQQMNKSPRASRPTALSISTASVSPELDMRSPRADRAPLSLDVPSEGALYCEFCETEGHDIVSCKQVFGSTTVTPAKPNKALQGMTPEDEDEMY